MSIVGVLTILILISHKLFVDQSKQRFLLIILLLSQFIFAYSDGYILDGDINIRSLIISIVLIALTVGSSRIAFRSYKKIAMGLLIILVIYTEFFNGIETFPKNQDFFENHFKIKKHLYLTPFKSTLDTRRYSDMANGDKYIKVYYFPNSYKAKEIKINSSGVYYFKSQGFGEGGYFVKFGETYSP